MKGGSARYSWNGKCEHIAPDRFRNKQIETKKE